MRSVAHGADSMLIILHNYRIAIVCEGDLMDQTLARSGSDSVFDIVVGDYSRFIVGYFVLFDGSLMVCHRHVWQFRIQTARQVNVIQWNSMESSINIIVC